MSRIIDRGLEEQSVLLTKMGELTYETLALSIRGYLSSRSVEQEVREMSDTLVAMADKVEDQAFQLIVRFQPVASDLRTIKSYMKIGYDFARYGRYSLDISYINDQLEGLKECDAWIREYINEMSTKVLYMVKTSIDSLRRLDITLAKSILQPEREVDQMYLDFLNRLIRQEQASSKCIISSSLMARYLERIADHATYVCESIVYIVTGEKIVLR
ncbi:MAG: phosphate signaling complex protein PhoU [Candidatus Bathyarchaeota archaeon]|nr:phosphate signaling complex protein PhoU [Candidatus Bathyarchaeota archaeon]